MESHQFLIHLVIILIAARALGELASWVKTPAVMGELFAGILIGPSLLNLVPLSDPIKLLSEVGVILLLFEVGLETDINRLLKAGTKALIVALGGVFAPLILGYLLAYFFFGFSTLTSLFIGGTLTATSIGITVRALKDLGKQKTHEAQIILGAAVIDDIIGIVLLSVLYEFSVSGNVDLWNAGKVMLFIAIYFLTAPFLANAISSVIHRWNEKTAIPGLLPTMIVSMILFFSYVAHLVGAPELLGGFAAGLALSKQFVIPFTKKTKKERESSHDFIHTVHRQMEPIIYLFAPIFFVGIGLSINLQEIAWNSPFIWLFSLCLAVLAIATKVLAGFLSYGESVFSKLIIGTAMVPRGEVGLIFTGIAHDSGVFTNESYAGLVLVIAITTILSPIALRLLYKMQTNTTD